MLKAESKSWDNLAWINWAKVICLFIVYFYHAESRSAYYIGRIDDVIEPFFVNIFFVISGYLIFKKQLKPDVISKSHREWFNSHGYIYLSNILYKIILPTIIFGALLYIPKVMVRGGELNLNHFLRHSVGGGGLWFTPALAISELLLFLLLLARIVNPIKVFVVSIGLCMVACVIHNVSPVNFPWYYQTGLCATMFLSFGGILYEIEKKRFKNNVEKAREMLWLLAMAVYLSVVLIITPPLTLNIVNVSVLGILIGLLSISIIIHYSRKLPQNKIIDRIGRHTLGLYFLSGALPESLCSIYRHFGNFNVIAVLVISFLSFVIGIIVNELMVQYIPFLFDLRKIK